MNKFKIVISPSKSFDLSIPTIKGKRPKYLDKAREIFVEIKKLSLKETKEKYNLSDKKALEVFNMHQSHGLELYHAIDLYDGLVFKQLDKNKYNKKWVNEHVIILDALYGIIKPYDLIAPYRLDFKSHNVNKNLVSIWKKIINEELNDYALYNLASKEFSSLINHKMTEVNLDKSIKQIKIARGKALNTILINKKVI